MKKFNKDIGSEGENLTKDYLLNRDFKILEMNFACKIGEIDVICEKKSTIHFVEVKSRFCNNYGYPCEAVNFQKKRKIFTVAQYYILSKKIKFKNFCFDVMEVYFNYNDNNTVLNFFEDAYRF
ncbi:putative endonuclease [Hathewaya proteolytica DSM 3090]|uniref:UPF0102 protein SAMN02745248_00074 n=1 Tax=Hathewaya proteolytica DSM 3090 TaxID=1121331 RepID=A0A1M6J7I2_9CLOT|nr:YraN family protein [Hathewaya proteolytica]SHJ42632.1 putative endonuclease [Hathewaya proteolytica DSM 3090]